MVVEHKIANQPVNLKIDYSQYFHKSWLDYAEFQELIESEYMDNLMHYIYQYYDKESNLYPTKVKHLFDSFKNIKFEDLRVVILNEAPPSTLFANGNGFGEENTTNPISNFNTTLRDIEKCITKSYPADSKFKFDRTLNIWNEQGVMVLNTALFTSWRSGDNNERQDYFRHFTRTIIKLINEYLTEVIFVFTDDSQEMIYEKYIEKEYHYTLKTDGFNSDSTIFNDINQLLAENAKPIDDWENILISW